ncbi:Uncharacterised protein [uncultured archaeon]|nr:Uncharacterised protein [uncultured archaeon]
MNNKGILFSVMVLFLLLSLASLHTATRQDMQSMQESDATLNAFIKAKGKYENLRNSIAELPKGNAEGTISARVLPFSYSIDGNNISISSDFPVQQASVQSYLEALNIFRVFAEDTNYAREYDSLHVDINVPLPKSWGGSDANLSFAEKPGCMGLAISSDSNSIAVGTGCVGFDMNSVKRIDLNITLDSGHDFNAMDCNFNDGSFNSCPHEDYNSQEKMPFFSATILDSGCGSCSLAQKTVSAHFDKSKSNFVRLRCFGTGCRQGEIMLSLGQGTEFSNSAKKAGISFSIDLNSQVESFYSRDANIMTGDSGFGIKVWE